MIKPQEIYVVMRNFYAKDTVECAFLDENAAVIHAEEMEKIEEGTWFVQKTILKDYPEDI